MESRARRILNLLQPPSHHRFDCYSEDDISFETENIKCDDEKENTPLESNSPEENTTDVTHQQATGFNSCQEKRPSQHWVAPVGSDAVIENRNIMTSPQKAITRRHSSSSSSTSSSSGSSSSSSSSNSSTTSSRKSPSVDHNFTRPSLEENADPQRDTSVANVSSPSILTSTCGLPSVGPRTVVRNYKISPLHSEESDVDLSDDDPTYNQEQNLRQRSLSTAAINSTDINYLYTSDDEPRKKPRKRKADPTKWIQNAQKIKRNLGQSYVAVHSKKLVPARSIKPPCGQVCRLKCSSKIDDSKRLEIFNAFWALGDRQLQRMYILSSSTKIKPKYKYTNAENPRNPNHAFYFSVNDERVRVCKTFFINTLSISQKMIRTIQAESKNTGGFIKDDQRGKHNNHKTTSDELINDIINFINSIPRVESHYLRASTSREYISSGKTIAELFRDFEVLQKERSRPAGLYHTFYDIFNSKFNLGFYQPKKDQCDLCLQFHNSSEPQKQELRDKYNTHLEEKKLSREEKKNDRKNIDECNFCVCYDVQAIMQSPNGDTSAFYYKSKLNSYNFTMTELNKIQEDSESTSDISKSYGNVHCFFWDETHAKRGATEIGSCVFHYLQMTCEKAGDRKVNITFISDNCCGQNKNKYLTCLYLYSVANIKNLLSITHKYLIKGHTQNEADNVHSLIQKQIAKDLKTGPIYSPVQYISAIKRARKTGAPFTVHSLTHNFFYDLQQLQEKWGYNFNTDEQKNNVVWNSIKVLKFTKDDPFSFYYKLSYKDEFKKVYVRNKRKRMPDIEEITMQKAYLEPLQLSSAKKNDLKDLINKQLIDPYYASYYNNMLS